MKTLNYQYNICICVSAVQSRCANCQINVFLFYPMCWLFFVVALFKDHCLQLMNLTLNTEKRISKMDNFIHFIIQWLATMPTFMLLLYCIMLSICVKNRLESYKFINTIQRHHPKMFVPPILLQRTIHSI